MFRAFADVQTAEMLDLPRPSLEGGKAMVVACPMSEEQHAIQQKLVERYERLRSGKVDPRIDNALNITTDGRKLAIDARMLSAAAPDCAGSKVNRVGENVAAVWERTAATRGTQMIFGDMGVHRPGHHWQQRCPSRRGCRRPGTLLRGGQGHCIGQPGGPDLGRGRRRVAATRALEEEPRR